MPSEASYCIIWSLQNGKLKEKNRTLTEMVNSMLNTFDLYENLRVEALPSACHNLNRFHKRMYMQLYTRCGLGETHM